MHWAKKIADRGQLAHGLFAVKVWTGETNVLSTVISKLDLVEETEVSTERPGLESPGLKLEKRDLWSFGGELRWSIMAPDRGDNPVNSQ